jgi:hypothetical protein
MNGNVSSPGNLSSIPVGLAAAGHQTDGGSLAEILVGPDATRALR